MYVDMFQYFYNLYLITNNISFTYTSFKCINLYNIRQKIFLETNKVLELHTKWLIICNFSLYVTWRLQDI